MSSIKRRGYRIERKIRMIFDENGWKTIRSGASLGEADLVCLRGGSCIFLQVKGTKDKKFYYYDYMEDELEGMPFYLVVDFGYGTVRVLKPQKIVTPDDGVDINNFLERFGNK